jgi:hypothetical protein
MPTKLACRLFAGDHLIAGDSVGEGPERLARLVERPCLDAARAALSWSCPAAAGFMSTNNGLDTEWLFSLHRE